VVDVVLQGFGRAEQDGAREVADGSADWSADCAANRCTNATRYKVALRSSDYR